MIQNIIFDLDGTLIDSSQDILNYLKKAYEDSGIHIPNKMDKRFIGPPLNDIIRSFTPGILEDEIKTVIQRFRKLYDSGVYPSTTPYPGIDGLLKKLKSMQFNLLIATNKPFIPTEKILKSLNIDIFFKDIMTQDKIPYSNLDKSGMIKYLIQKWSLNSESTLMVGDSEQDILAAQKNRLLSAAVSWGYGNNENLEKSKPTYLLNSAEELYNLLK